MSYRDSKFHCLLPVNFKSDLRRGGIKGGIIRPISGRFRAAAINALVCCCRYSGVLPAMSWIIIVNPAPTPSPGIGGGPNARTVPLVISLANTLFSFSHYLFNCLFPLSPFFAITKNVATLDWYA